MRIVFGGIVPGGRKDDPEIEKRIHAESGMRHSELNEKRWIVLRRGGACPSRRGSCDAANEGDEFQKKEEPSTAATDKDAESAIQENSSDDSIAENSLPVKQNEAFACANMKRRRCRPPALLSLLSKLFSENDNLREE